MRRALRAWREAQPPTLLDQCTLMPAELSTLQPAVAQARMVVGPPPKRPAEFPLRLRDRQIVDARETAPHQPLFVELPVLVAVAAEPGTRVVVPLVGEAHRDAVTGARPQLLDEPVVELARPLALEERAHLLAAHRELGAVPPVRVLGVDLHDPVGVAGVPGV